MSLSLSVSMISGNKDGWYSKLASVKFFTHGCFTKDWINKRNMLLFWFDFSSDLFNGFKVDAGIFVDNIVLFVVVDHVDDDLLDCIWYLFHFLSSLEGVWVG